MQLGNMAQYESSRPVSRRAFVRGLAGTAGSAAIGGEAAAQSDGNGSGGTSASGPIDFGGWLEDVSYWGGQANDQTGKQKVTITVGGDANNGLSFAPVAVHVDPGTTVTWEWSGNGGAHNVVAEDDSFKSGSPVAQAGTTFSHTLDGNGVNNYYCQPHRSQGMKGSVAVGQVPHKSQAAQQEVKPEEMGVPIQPHYVGIAAVLTMMSSLVFVFYLLKYGESPHAKGGDQS